MMVEIKGVQFVNKGAELMLISIMEQFRNRCPDAEFVLTPRGASSTYKSIARLGCYIKPFINRRGYNLLAPVELIPKKLLVQFGLVPESGIDIVLDASGFVYFSGGGMPYIRETARRIRKWKKSGKKVIFLPQAFGPFEGKRDKKFMNTIIDNADLVCARDGLSRENLKRIKDSDNIELYPDFTNLTNGSFPIHWRRLEGRVPVITNYGMIVNLPPEKNRKYIPLMARAVKHLFDAGCDPYFLMHEGEMDQMLANQIMEEVGREMEIISECDPLVVKGIIGASRGVLSSRFHGLVSALSMGVPALGTGWSHKYEALFEDYQFQEGILSLGVETDDLHEKLTCISDEKKNLKLRQKLGKRAQILKQTSRRMWDRVFGIIQTP